MRRQERQGPGAAVGGDHDPPEQPRVRGHSADDGERGAEWAWRRGVRRSAVRRLRGAAAGAGRAADEAEHGAGQRDPVGEARAGGAGRRGDHRVQSPAVGSSQDCRFIGVFV